jgi:hypothetical protein
MYKYNIRIKKIKISIFPNPVSDKIIVTSDVDISEIKLFNILGELLYDRKIDAGIKVIEENIIDLPIGIYFVETINGDLKPLRKKIIKTN